MCGHDHTSTSTDRITPRGSVSNLPKQTPTPNEIVVERAQPLRWAERDGTYAELLERRSQSLNTLPGR